MQVGIAYQAPFEYSRVPYTASQKKVLAPCLSSQPTPTKIISLTSFRSRLALLGAPILFPRVVDVGGGGVSSRGNGHSKVYTGVATLYPGHHIRLPDTTKELASMLHFYSTQESAISKCIKTLMFFFISKAVCTKPNPSHNDHQS